MPKPTMGLIAGGGQLPFIQAQGMRAAGHRVACVGLWGQYDPELREVCDDFAESGVLNLGRWCRQLRKRGATQAVMVGKVEKSRLLYDPVGCLKHMPDWRAAKLYLWDLRHDRRSQMMLAGVADALKKGGSSSSTPHASYPNTSPRPAYLPPVSPPVPSNATSKSPGRSSCV